MDATLHRLPERPIYKMEILSSSYRYGAALFQRNRWYFYTSIISPRPAKLKPYQTTRNSQYDKEFSPRTFCVDNRNIISYDKRKLEITN